MAQWITSPLRDNDSFPHFSSPATRPAPSDGATADQPRPMERGAAAANNASNGYRPPESGSLADVFALARTVCACLMCSHSVLERLSWHVEDRALKPSD